MTTKTKIAIGVIGLLGFMAFGKKKVDETLDTLEKLKFKIVGARNVNLQLPIIQFNLMLQLINPTQVNFSGSLGSSLVFKRIRVYNNNGVLLGSGDLDLYDIEIPSNSALNLNDIPVQIDTDNILSEFFNNVQNYINHDFSNLKYKIDIEFLGKSITLDT